MNRRSFLKGALTLVFAQNVVTLRAQAVDASGCALAPHEVETLLRIHNQARTEAGVPSLTWSPALAAYAQKWADNLAQTDEFEHSRGPYGENLASADDVEQAVNLWLSEKSLYRGVPFGAGSREYGHYSQVVWKKTTKVGCGKAISRDETIWVCSYDPAGNIRGQSAY